MQRGEDVVLAAVALDVDDSSAGAVTRDVDVADGADVGDGPSTGLRREERARGRCAWAGARQGQRQ